MDLSGYWEVMKDDMKGVYEVRVDGPGRHHYRLFCLLDYEAQDREKPLLIVVAGSRQAVSDSPLGCRLCDGSHPWARSISSAIPAASNSGVNKREFRVDQAHAFAKRVWPEL
jgi:hypothetical protein